MTTRLLLAHFGALLLLLAGAFAGVLGASTGRWWTLALAAPLILAALALLAWVVVARNRGRHPT